MSDREAKPTGPDEIPVEAVTVEVQLSNEPWSTYQLADGTRLRMKQVVSEVLRIPGKFDSDGNPAYLVKAGAVLMIESVPTELKKQKL